MVRKMFTPKEANRRLPLVKKIVGDILSKGKALRSFFEQSKGGEVPGECLTLQAEIEELLSELEDLGCFYKDWNFEIGLVDFPAVIEGEDVLLCWRSDEKELRFYHSLEDGYLGRQLIPPHFLN